ncbi:kelch domain-containing protein 1 isoform X2 [Myotis yumanensis]|uniref:kelch domain-containing protein 1 isoform X2 n=1 Tax=Myotis yumanensis TaxID=159337 RepID=UPI0038D02C97
MYLKSIIHVFYVFSLLKTMKYICLMMKFGPMILIVGCGQCTSWKENSLPPCQEVVVLALMESCTFLEDMMTKDTAIEDGTYVWEKITNFEGKPPTPRDKLSCWVYKDRLIYFGGYGCRRHNELQDCFDVHDASWEEQIFWGWHNDVHVFDTKTQNWFQPEIKGGVPPQPRAAHTCAVLGNKGYIFGGRVLQTRMNDLHYLNLDTWIWSGRIPITGENPKHRSWHTLTPIADDKLFLFGGLSADNIPLSDGWIHNVITNCWKQLTYLPKTRPRLWHTACLGKENEIMVFGGSKDDLLSLDTGHCNDLLIFQTQPYSLLRSCLDCIGKNAIILESQISLLPPKLLQQVLKKITFWTAANHREEQRAQKEETENKYQWICNN